MADVYARALDRLDEFGCDHYALPLLRALLIERRDREPVMVHFDDDPTDAALAAFVGDAHA